MENSENNESTEQLKNSENNKSTEQPKTEMDLIQGTPF